jgi:hypothetical protein
LTTATAKKPERKPTIWAILDRERNVQLYVGREAPYLDGAFAAAPRGTRFLGQLCGPDAKRTLGLELHKMGQPVEVTVTVEPKKKPRRSRD